ncbi:MAG: OmpA family protein [Bacteroidetes bacterium]|nr:OmpA family protein [Bacteroidota bacterium]
MKRKLFRFIPLLFLASAALAQNHGLGIHFGAYDFYGPQTGSYFFTQKNYINYASDNAKNDTTTQTRLLWHPMIKVTYWWQISSHFDFNIGLSLANLQYPNGKPDSEYIKRVLYNEGARKEKYLGELDARINFNILDRRKYIVSPYLFAGLTASMHSIYYGADVPVGLGFNIMLSKEKDFYLNLESAYKVAITGTDQNHLQHAIGFTYWFKPHYHEAVPAPVVEVAPPSDVDHDGVPDSADKCPTVPGLAAFNGCPDSDGDGVPDNLDACPLVAGNAGFNGCPDTDGDGIPDNTDKCPYQAGLAQYNGCPPPDADHDGVNDSEDQCPNVPGTVENHGCPEIRKEVIEKVEKAARSVYFETGKSALKKVSYKSLNTIAQVMKDDPSLYVDIGGHTDNVGSDDRNMTLSDARANVCRDYLISQGISADRITAKGYGETQPIADNKTATGRAQNRRTEFKLSNYRK